MTTNKPAALSVESVAKNYGEVQALRGVSFEVKPGEVFGLLGPNGAGKTSLISIIVTLEKATSGRVAVFGHDVQTNTREAKVRVGWVPQEVINHGFFDVEEILNFQSGYYGVKPAPGHIEKVLKSLNLWEHRRKKVKQLSGGMKRRLMIAKALVIEPGILILDEPTAGVDVELRQKLWDLIEDLKAQGMSILLTTHYLEEAERLCDRVAIIHKGKIQAIGPTRGLIEQWSRKKIVLKLTAPRALSHPDLLSGEGAHWEFLTSPAKTLGQLLVELKIGPAELADVQVEDGKLEEAFVRLTQNEEVKA